MDDIDANSNVIVGNWIGTNATGTAALGNGGDGVFVSGSSSVIIGGTAAGAGNLISSNATNGIEINDSTRTLIQGNLIGLDQTGTLALGNHGAGVLIDDGSVSNTVGSPVAGGRNFISGNAEGILITGSSTAATDVAGNLIGTDVEGTAAVGNLTAGVVVAGGTGATIGAADGPAGNVISGNIGDGIDIGAGAVNTWSRATTSVRTRPEPSLCANSGSGVSVDDAAGRHHRRGGAGRGQRDLGQRAGRRVDLGDCHDGRPDCWQPHRHRLHWHVGPGQRDIRSAGERAPPGVTIGGTATGDGNIISGNPTAGIGLYAGTTGAPSKAT